MSRTKSGKQSGLKLPQKIRDELELRNGNGGSGLRRESGIALRKQNRKAMRSGRRHGNEQTLDQQRHALVSTRAIVKDSEINEEEPIVQHIKKKGSKQEQDSVLRPKSIPKKTKTLAEPRRSSHDDSEYSEEFASRGSSPGLVLDASSKSFRDRAARDDAEILALEKRLGMKNKKSASMGDDELDFILNGIEDEDSGKRRRRDGQEWLNTKRRKTSDLGVSSEDAGSDQSDKYAASRSIDETSFDMGDLTEDSAEEDFEGQSDQTFSDVSASDLSMDAEDQDQEDFSGFESEGEGSNAKNPAKAARENPYVAPVVSGALPNKYVPPSLRKRNEGDQELLVRLKRQTQGHLNKLSEANIISILAEIENLYRNNPRQDVTTVLIDLLLSLFCNRSALQNTFIILHASFVVAVYKVMGTDFGAEMLVKLVERFDAHHGEQSSGKEALNLVSFLANLFTFSMISSQIIFDHIRLLLSSFSESNAELLLRIVRDCGPQLRSDDPLALKAIVQMIQDVSTEMSRSGQQMNIRTRVMIDTITDLKNNKLKGATNAAGATGEHITRMRKALGTLNSRSLKATEPLRITRDDIANSEKKGKWWLVGASWKGDESQRHVKSGNQGHGGLQDELSDAEVDYLSLAKQYRMNTDVRRSIFVAIMSATDVRDAQTRLLKLRLSNKQEQEIAKVVLRCARSEPAYNPYYSLLVKNLCKESRRIRIGFQFGLWQFFRSMGEKDDEDDEDNDDDQTVELHEIANIAKMYAFLVLHGHLTLGILKTLNIGFLREQATMFLEVFLISVITQPKSDQVTLARVFESSIEAPQMIKSLQYFIKEQLRQSDLVSKKDKARVRDGCRIADAALTAAASAGTRESV